MALISQILAVSFPAIVKDKSKPANQWAESAFLREFERQGALKRESLGPTIEAPLDYQRNPGAVFQATDLQPLSLSKTEVITTATYSVAELVVPMTWSKKDEVMNSSINQKVALVKSIAENGLETHDDMLEQYIFATTTNGFLGLETHITAAGTGSDGGIDSSTNTWWRSQANIYVDDTDIEAAMTTTWNQCAKGSGSKLLPTLIVSDAATQSLFEGTQQANQRYIDTEELKAGFKILGFKTSRYVFSQYAGNSGAQYFLNPKNLMLICSKDAFRERLETQKIVNATGYSSDIYSALQLITNNRSRLGMTKTAASV